MHILLKEWGGVKMSDERVTNMIRNAVRETLDSGETIGYRMCGDTLVMVLNYADDDLSVYVSKVKQYGVVPTDAEVITI